MKPADYQKALHAAYQDVLATNQGRMVLQDILNLTSVDQSPFTGATNQTIKNVGMQDVGRLIVQRLRAASPDNYLRMIREGMNDD